MTPSSPESEPRPKSYREDVAAAMAGLAGPLPGVTFRRTFGCPAYYVGGKMFACVYGDGIALKLPPERIEELPGPTFGPFSPGGKMIMGGWIAISRPAASEFALDIDLIEEALEYVASLVAAGPPASQRARKRQSGPV